MQNIDDDGNGYDWWEVSRLEWLEDKFANITVNGQSVLDWLAQQPDKEDA